VICIFYRFFELVMMHMVCYYAVQWLVLVRVFDDIDMCRRLQKHAEDFLAVHTKFVVRILVSVGR